MTDDRLRSARTSIGERIAELEARMPRLAPRAISQRMDAIRALAAKHGLAALEGLADYGAHHALMPGHRTATRECLAHMDEALASERGADREAILAALALRLH
ncbi:hypothetical protein [Sphingomonas mesophila]|uniref:hypothetical protein n=1 Tax=Sphingomonas mesophila TaxID=2303576 RepID=UPI000E57D880|nr:hypothetical protein [Sphingomonas mesophila]